MKIKTKALLEYICWFLILLVPFNYTIINKLYFSSVFMLGSIIIAIVILFLMHFKRKITKKQVFLFLIMVFIIFIEFFDNYYIKQGRILNVILFNVYLMIPFVLSFYRCCEVKKIYKILEIFLMEHIIATIFVQIFPNFYSNSIIKWIADGDLTTLSLLKYWHNEGYNAGLTAHYSTNGIYLAIAFIYYFVELVQNKNKKNMILMILAFITLMLTGKRAQALFSIIACFCVYLYNKREGFSKKFLNTGIIIFSFFILIYVVSMFVPQVLNVVNRFEEAAGNKSELLTGRELLYDTSITNWKKHVLFGNGWGFFSEYYQNYIYNPSSAYYNIKYIDDHNVYLQLLCETGIVGLVCFLILEIIVVFKEFKIEKKLSTKKENSVLFLLGYNIFFVLYCFSGNPLYDIQCYALFFILIGVLVMYENVSEKIDNKE